MGKGQIAGILQCLRCFFRPMSLTAPAVQQLRASGNLLRAAAVKVCFQINGTAVQRRRHGQHLESRARFIAIGKHTVAPLLQLRIAARFRISFLSLFVRVAAFRILLIAACQFFQCFGAFFVPDLQILIGIVAAQCGHCQYFTGFGVHDQPESAVFHIVACNCRLHLLFKAALQGYVQRQNQAVALLACDVLFIRKRHIHLVIAL